MLFRSARLGGDAEDHAGEHAGGWVAQAEVGQEGDQSRLCLQRAVWIEAHGAKGSRDPRRATGNRAAAAHPVGVQFRHVAGLARLHLQPPVTGGSA